MDKKAEYIIGIDEVGRGPIAGPVAVGAFLIKPDACQEFINYAKKELKLPIRDSKKLTKIQREKWFKFLSEKKKIGECDFAVTMVSAEWIDKVGIVRAIQKALNTSLNKISNLENKNSSRFTPEGPYATQNSYSPDLPYATKNSHHLAPFFSVFLDGGLKAPEEYTNQETIIKGDELHPVISFASIVAKVSRDRVMELHAVEYPEYSFDANAGYGTKAHYAAIRKHGMTVLHRKTFIHI